MRKLVILFALLQVCCAKTPINIDLGNGYFLSQASPDLAFIKTETGTVVVGVGIQGINNRGSIYWGKIKHKGFDVSTKKLPVGEVSYFVFDTTSGIVLSFIDKNSFLEELRNRQIDKTEAFDFNGITSFYRPKDQPKGSDAKYK